MKKRDKNVKLVVSIDKWDILFVVFVVLCFIILQGGDKMEDLIRIIDINGSIKGSMQPEFYYHFSGQDSRWFCAFGYSIFWG